MGKNDGTTITTAEASNSPEIITDTRKKSISNPLKSFRDFKAGESAKVPTATPTSDSLPATTALEDDTYHGMMRATRGMSPEEVKAFLEQKAQVDREKYKDDGTVGGLYWNRSVGNQQT